MKMTSFSINGLSVSRLSINGRAVSLGKVSALCDALCFTAQEAGSTVKLHKVNSAPAVNLQTSTNGSSWTPYTVEDTITLANVNDKVYFKAVGSNNKISDSLFGYNKFVITGKIAASGNVNSLLEEDEETARTMSLEGKSFCYAYMFRDETGLTQAPELPATALADYCYTLMFRYCTSLVQAPELPATTLANYCYNSMFDGCSNLASIDVNFTDWYSITATEYWLDNVASIGTFRCPQALIDNTTERGGNTVPESWNMVAV